MRGVLGSVRSARDRLRTVSLSAGGRFERAAPSPQTAVDAVPGLWASRFPPPLADVRAGDAPLFDDPRIHWGFAQVGGVAGKRVLDLGPLEGAHSAMAHAAGAARVVSVEANREAYLKCLVTKELLGLERWSPRCGDALAYLAATDETFDVCIACGLLYHLAEPVRLIELIARRADSAIVWTHVYDEHAKALYGRKMGPAQEVEHAGFRHVVHRHRYGPSRRLAGFWGGTQPFSNWLTPESLLGALEHFGWSEVQTGFDEVHPHGRALTLAATHGAASARAAA